MKNIINWFVHNPIAANLLMLLIIVSGLLNIPRIDKEFFPQSPATVIEVLVPYLGAGPKEVEEQICIRLEEAIHDLDGIEKIVSTARQGLGATRVEVEADYDSQRLLNDIKSRVDSLSTLPGEAERPQIKEVLWRHQMLSLALAGDLPENTLKQYGEKIRDELAALPHVSVVNLSGTRPYEMSIEVSENNLRRYNLGFQHVVDAIRNSSLNLPAGSIRANSGDIQLQTRGQAYTAADFEHLVLIHKLDGTRVLLGDVATVVDGFVDTDSIARFNGKPAVFLDIQVSNNPDVLKTSATVKRYIKESARHLPQGLELTAWRDTADPFRGRVETLLNNGIGGLALVFIVLMLFLRPLLAMWVSLGIAVSFLGAFWLMPYTGTSLNMISLFAFLLILGVVVDDAIIVSESIYAEQSEGLSGRHGASVGAQRVAKPILFAVISTMIVFVPMFNLPGDSAHAAMSIPAVVLLTLLFSLIESLFILPSHLSHMPPIPANPTGIMASFERLRQRFGRGMIYAANTIYTPLLARSLRWHWLTIALFISFLLVSITLFSGGWLRFSFMPNVTSDFLIARVTLPEGGPFSDSKTTLELLENTAQALQDKHQYQDSQGQQFSYISNIQVRANANNVTGWVELDRERRGEISAKAMRNEWRELIGDLPNADDFVLSYTINRQDKALQFVLSGPDNSALKTVSAELQKLLKSYPGVYDVSDSMQSPRPEIELDLKPQAETLNISLANLAQQVRQGFYGAEVQRIPRGKEDVKVMVRYPEAERKSPDHLHYMRIRSPGGEEIPFDTVADVHYVPSYHKIDRIDRQRTITVSAELQKDSSDSIAIVDDIMKTHAPQWQLQNPGLVLTLEGEQRERTEFMSALGVGIVQALIVIYGLFAVAFRSYWQPVIILTAVPFGFMGAILGHLLMGREVSIFSLLGVLACAGVVVNDNLVLIDRINQLREQGEEIVSALLRAGKDRFRPIILTSLTTFIGLLPIMSETSLQAQFLIPMVISLAFGVLVATTVTLILVPILYLLGERFKEWLALHKPELRKAIRSETQGQ
jgi:multidrug efflux pump subunit AcrB